MNRWSPEGRRRRQRLPGEQRYRQLLDVAISVFAQVGYSKAGTSDIAKAAGVAEPTIYRHFSSKHELFLVALRKAWEQVLDAWREMAAASADPATALKSIARSFYGEMRGRPDLILAYLRASQEADEPEVREAARDILLEAHNFIRDLYRRAQGEGQFAAKLDPETQAWLFLGMGHLMLAAQALDLWDQLPESRLDSAVEQIVYGKG